MSDEESNEAPPTTLATTRKRRANAGARMSEMIAAAEQEKFWAQAYGIKLDSDDESSEDGEYVPKDLKNNESNGKDGEDGEENDDDGDDDDDGSSSSGSSDEDDSDEEDSAKESNNEIDSDGPAASDLDDLEDEVRMLIDTKCDIKQLPMDLADSSNTHRRASFDNKNVVSKSACQGDTKPAHAKVTGCPDKSSSKSILKICSVCLNGQIDEDDEIIECDSCGIPVHESCYGVSNDDSGDKAQLLAKHNNKITINKIASNRFIIKKENTTNDEDDIISIHSNASTESTEPWFCEPCKRSVRQPSCELCPNSGGIFKETDTGRWVHMVCALYTPGVTFEDVANLKQVSLFEINYSLYGSKVCTICEDRRHARSGLCIECDAGLCKTFFHVTCAQKEGLLFESHSDEVDPYFAQCQQHADKTIIKKKKRSFMALNATQRKIEPGKLYSDNDRIRNRLKEFTSQSDLMLQRWNESNRPPIPIKVSRMLMTSPSVITKLNRKSELAGLDPGSSFMSIQDEIEMARQKWHIPPSFNLEFVAYSLDRNSRMISMNKRNSELIKQNTILKLQESKLREKHDNLKLILDQHRAEVDSLVKNVRELQSFVNWKSGKQCKLPPALEQLLAKASSSNEKTQQNNKPSEHSRPTLTTFSCQKCKTIEDQHLLSLCDTCNFYYHIYCLDPPLTRVPKKTKFGGWQCSDCSEKDEEEEEAVEKQNELAFFDAKDGPRRLRAYF